MPRELGGAGDAANPEHPFAAGDAARFAGSVEAAAETLAVFAAAQRICADSNATRGNTVTDLCLA